MVGYLKGRTLDTMENHVDQLIKRMSRKISLLVMVLACVIAPLDGVSQSGPVSEEYRIPSGDPGVELYIRNKRPASMSSFAPDRVVLFIHGATYPSEVTFDLNVGGFSWMDYIAQQGYDVYLMDVRGYGRSTRPKEMSIAPDKSKPVVHTDVAVRDLATVVDHIRSRRRVSSINLIAWSWGTVIAGAFTASNNNKVTRLVLYGPLWIQDSPKPPPSAPIDAYRTVTKEVARQRQLVAVPAVSQATLMPKGWFDAWWEANMQADTVGARQSPQVVRAPNGFLEDGFKYWGADRRFYDPSHITVPVLLVHGEWEFETPAYMSQAVFSRLVNSPLKRYVVIGAGTHAIMIERNRMQLFREVQLFLDDSVAAYSK